MQKTLVIGHSHTNALALAVEASRRRPKILVIHLLNLADRFYQDRSSLLLGQDGIRFDEKIVNVLDDYAPKALYSMIGGNANHILGLLQMTEPFDFQLPHQPDLLLDDSVISLSFGSICARIAEIAAPHLQQIRALGAYGRERGICVYHLESPPPIGDDGHIMANLDPYFASDRFAKKPLTARCVRYKLWRVHSYVSQRICAEAEVQFLSVPSGSAAADGFLLPKFFPNNATHANDLYGHLLIDQIEKVNAQAGESV